MSNLPAKGSEAAARVPVVKSLDDAQVTLPKLAEKLHEGLEARRHVVVDGSLLDVPDYKAQHSFLRLAYELRGAFPEKGAGPSSGMSYEDRLRRAGILPSVNVTVNVGRDEHTVVEVKDER